jgi:hypothetical protein
VVVPARLAGADHLAARRRRGVGGEPFESACDVAPQIGIRIRDRRRGDIGGRQQGQVVDEEDPGIRGVPAHLRAHRAQRVENRGEGTVTRVAVQQLGDPRTEQRQAPCHPRQCRRHQQWDVADVVAADRDRDQRLGAVQRGDLGRRTVLPVGEHVRRGGTRERDVDQLEVATLGHQVRIVGGGSARPSWRAVGLRRNSWTRCHRTAQRDIPFHSSGLDACAQKRLGIRPARRAR